MADALSWIGVNALHGRGLPAIDFDAMERHRLGIKSFKHYSPPHPRSSLLPFHSLHPTITCDTSTGVSRLFVPVDFVEPCLIHSISYRIPESKSRNISLLYVSSGLV